MAEVTRMPPPQQNETGSDSPMDLEKESWERRRIKELNESLDMAERFLLLGSFHEASLEATKALKSFYGFLQTRNMLLCDRIRVRCLTDDCSKDIEQDVGEIEEKDELEKEQLSLEFGQGFVKCAGAVLVQSYHEMDRHKELMDLIRQIFGSPAQVPKELLIIWVSLQLTAEEISVARATLEEYLEGIQLGLNCTVTVACRLPKERKDDSDQFAFWEELGELYSVKLLAEIQGDTDSAVAWIQSSQKLSENSKQVLLQKVTDIGNLSESLIALEQPSFLNSGAKYLPMPNGSLASDVREVISFGNVPTSNSLSPARTNLFQKNSRATNHYTTWLPYLPIWASKLFTVHKIEGIKVGVVRSVLWLSMNRRRFMTTMLWVLVLLSTIRGRHLLNRWRIFLLRMFKYGFLDLWRLAFTLNLNPLATMQTSPPRIHQAFQ